MEARSGVVATTVAEGMLLCSPVMVAWLMARGATAEMLSSSVMTSTSTRERLDFWY